jgi:hypothetical protein
MSSSSQASPRLSVSACALLFCCQLAACSRTPLDGEPAPGAGGAAGTSGSGGSTTTSTTPAIRCTDAGSLEWSASTQYDGTFVPVMGSDKQYYVQTNWWSLYDGQTVKVNGLAYTLGNPRGATSYSNNPMGYPSFFIGSYAGHATRGGNLPKQVSALTQVPTTLATNGSSMGRSNYNASYDVWFTAGPDPLPSYQYSPGAGGAYLMVWLFMPSDRQPRGSLTYQSQKVASLPGTWDVWIDNSNPPCITYVSTTQVDRVDFDLNGVIQNAVKYDYGVTSSMYLSIIFGGFEVWGEGDGLRLEAFCADVL